MKALFLTVVLLPSVLLLHANAFAPPQLYTPLKVVSSTKHVTKATTSLHAASANCAIDSVLFRATTTPNISSSMSTTSPPLLLRRRQGGRKEMILARCLAVALAMTTTTVLEQGRGSVAHAASTTITTTTANRIHNSNLAPSIRPVVRVKRKIAATSTMSKQSLMETSTANNNNNLVRVMTGTGVVLGAAGAGLYVGDSVRKQQKQSSTNDDDDELPEKTMLANFSSNINIKEPAFKKVELEQVQEEEQPAVMEMVVEQKEEQVVEAAAKTAATNEATRQFFQRVLEEQQQKLEKARQEKIANVMNNGAKIAKTIGFTTRIVDQKPPPVIITNDDEPAPNGYITREEEEPPVYPTSYTDMSVEEPVMIEDEPMVSSTIPVALPMGTVPISMPPVEHDVLSAPIVERPRLVPQPVEVATTPSNTSQQQQRRLPLMTAKYIKARKQPKSPKDELKLAEKYAAIDSLEERAFQILVDLGMVEVNEATDNNNSGN